MCTEYKSIRVGTNVSADMVISRVLPAKESKTMISWQSDFTLSVIHSPVPRGYFIVKLCQIMAARKAFVTFSKDSSLSGEPVIFLNKYKITLQYKIDELFC